MAVPKKRTSKSKTNMRRSHDAVREINIIYDKITGEPRRSHHASADGTYNGRIVVEKKN